MPNSGEADDQIVLYPKRKRVITYAIGGYFGAAAMICALIFRETFDFPLLFLFLAVPTIFLMTGSAVWNTRRAFSREPVLVMNNKGFQDNTSFIGVDWVAWDEIYGWHINEVYKQKWIIFLVENPQAIISRQRSTFKKLLMRLNSFGKPSPVQLLANELPISFNDLQILLVDYIEPTA